MRGCHILKHLVLMFSHFDTGGLQTLMLRMAEWCKSNDIRCLIIFESCDEQMFRTCKVANIDYLHSFDGRLISEVLRARIDAKKDLATVVTFELPEFLFFEEIRRKWLGDISIQHAIYNVSVGSMLYGMNIGGLTGRTIRILNRLLFVVMHKANQVYYMDAETRDVPFDELGLSRGRSDSIVIPLPMSISENTPLPHRYADDRMLLTVSRSVFPYKGYLLGLVRDFPKLKRKYRDLRLRIITFGQDMPRLKRAIESCPEYAKPSIELIGQSTPDEIKVHLKDAWLYLGMGTTVLDAANEGVPSIVACHSTEDNLCVGFFNDNPLEIARAKKGVLGSELIEKAAGLSSEAYDSLSIETNEAFRNIYNIETIIPTFLNIKEMNVGCFRSLLYRIGYLVFYKARIYRRKRLGI